MGTPCPIVACDGAPIEVPVAVHAALRSAAPLSDAGDALDLWESEETTSTCAHDVWETAESASPCTYDGCWDPGAPAVRVDEPPCCTGAVGASRPRDHEAPCAPLRPEVLQGYFPLVRKLVRQVARHLPPNVQRDDLLGAGLLGLVDSLRKNGGSSDGETFAGYAKLRIRGAIVDELRAQDWLSRRAREAVEAEAEAAGKVGAGTVFVSLSEVTPTEESVHMSGEDDPIEAMAARATQRALAGAIAQLPERERRVIGMYYFEGAKLKDIGAELGVGEPRVSQLHTRALGMLRGLLSQA
ncbi:RNA polymerase sigma factor [Sorangium cellulosum]|uniref:RNA polymerase sigma factor n=1 Tax=Sorangium cellulosum TaxID=56 RepID=A0A2L0F379_SORCE|nr:sigma-70 family RNA polymerase sigma factor [Sorangium cellulosum]AUX46010.1 RNA polymerase sigma factor [Sorangium cellulosum]